MKKIMIATLVLALSFVVYASADFQEVEKKAAVKETFEGLVTEVTETSVTVESVENDKEQQTLVFKILDKTKFNLRNDIANSDDLEVGDFVRIKYTGKGKNLKAKKIKIIEKATEKEQQDT